MLIHRHLDVLKVEVLITGWGSKAHDIGKKLKGPMLLLHRPLWNSPSAPFLRKE